jgi:hypothetical protein
MRSTTFYSSTAEAAAALGVSTKTLQRMRLSGILKPGVHFRARGAGATRPQLRWNVEATEAALARRTKALGLGTGRGEA